MSPSPFQLPDDTSPFAPVPVDLSGTSHEPPTPLAANPAQATPADKARPLTVTPVLAAFGPAVSLVSVDEDGRLWMRLSTAVAMMLGGALLFIVPMGALWWIGGDMIDSGRISITDQPGVPSTGPTLPPANDSHGPDHPGSGKTQQGTTKKSTR